jgi:hypothetical protein
MGLTGKLFAQVLPMLLCIPCITIAQSTKNFSGDYTNALGERGTANYGYYIKDERTVPHGKFRFSTAYEDTAVCNRHVSRSANGEYANGRKNGKWGYEFRELNVTVERMDGLRAITRTDGTQKKLSAQFTDGVASGTLTFSDEDITNGRVTAVVRSGNVSFRVGLPQGEMAYDGRHRDRRVRGGFDSNGNFHGNWVITESDSIGTYRDERTYRNGFLTHLRLTLGDSLLHDLSYDDVIAKLDRLEQGDTTGGYSIGPRAFGVTFDDGFTATSPYLTAQDMGNHVIVRAQDKLFGTASEPFAYRGLDTLHTGSTRRFIYTYTAKEEQALLNSSLLLDSLKVRSDRYLENRSLMMNHQKSDSLAFTFGWLITLQSKLGQLRKAVDKLNSDDFRYQDRTNYYREGIACAADVDSVRYDFDGEERIRAVRNEACVTDGVDVILNIERFLKVLDGHLTVSSEFLDGELKLLRREQQLFETEETILALTDSVFISYKGRTETEGDNGKGEEGFATPLHGAVFRNLMVQTRKRMLQDYSNLEGYSEKQEKGIRILALLNTLIDAHQRLVAVAEMPVKLDEAFTAFEYNPYMATHDIKVRKKKRIYEKGVLELLPYLVRGVEGERDFERFNERMDELFKLYGRLEELSKQPDSETSKLERRLRAESDPERIKRLLDI